LAPLLEEWKQALAVVAHPDDLETARERGCPLDRCGPLGGVRDRHRRRAGINGPRRGVVVRRQEQVASAAIVVVDDVTFLGHRDRRRPLRPGTV
jgi:LmbE family N-acetylglucosaminyl deacetylase